MTEIPFWSTSFCLFIHPMSTSTLRVAILDDYQRVALTVADWSSIQDQLSIDVFTDTISSEDALAQRLEPYTIICAMRERTKFSASLLDRLPNLKLIATTCMRNAAIDITHAKYKGIIVSGATGKGNSTLEHIWALILATARYLVTEDRNMKEGKTQWQSTLPMGLSGRTLGLIGVGGLGSHTAAVSNSFVMAGNSDEACIIRLPRHLV
jgi:phosphoglycerate dehydrogenase-like enzyme